VATWSTCARRRGCDRSAADPDRQLHRVAHRAVGPVGLEDLERPVLLPGRRVERERTGERRPRRRVDVGAGDALGGDRPVAVAQAPPATAASPLTTTRPPATRAPGTGSTSAIGASRRPSSRVSPARLACGPQRSERGRPPTSPEVCPSTLISTRRRSAVLVTVQTSACTACLAASGPPGTRTASGERFTTAVAPSSLKPSRWLPGGKGRVEPGYTGAPASSSRAALSASEAVSRTWWRSGTR
jgi:hypothetical protein